MDELIPKCSECGAHLSPERLHRVRFQNRARWVCEFCAVSKRRKRHRAQKQRYREDRRYAKTYPAWTIAASSVGALSELLVAADLLRRGMEVFRAVSPAASCDLLVQAEGRILRVEVKTARRGKNGLSRPPVKKGSYDVVARVEPDGVIHYSPRLDALKAA